MVALDPVPVGEAAVAVASPQVALGSLAALGLLGVTDWILGDDEPPESTDEPAGGSGMFEDAETAGDGGIAEGAGGDGGDEFDFDEGGADDGFGDFDVDGMDEEGGGGGGGAQVRELERRVEEMEDELSGISSTVSTVRTENEQISESVDDIEENVRKLLDIYKMVTKGVNPFVDEDGGGGFGGEGASLGLFDQEDDEQEAGQLDEDVTDADAEEFFDDDFEEEEALDEASTEDDTEDIDQAMAQSDAPDDEGGAKSFDELREEYEDGAEWSEEDDGDAAAEENPDAGDDGEGGADAAEAADESEADADPEPEEPHEGEPESQEGEPGPEADEAVEEGALDEEPVDDERVDALFEEDAATEQDAAGTEAGAHQPAPGAAAQPRSQAPPQTGARQPVAGGAPGEKPYLRELPSGYVSDLLVMEWVEFLVTESSPAGAHRAITYYENVGWVGHRAADQLREFVDGHPEASAGDGADGDGALTMDHHTTSLRYVARITGDVQENVLASWDDGDNRWLQR